MAFWDNWFGPSEEELAEQQRLADQAEADRLLEEQKNAPLTGIAKFGEMATLMLNAFGALKSGDSQKLQGTLVKMGEVAFGMGQGQLGTFLQENKSKILDALGNVVEAETLKGLETQYDKITEYAVANDKGITAGAKMAGDNAENTIAGLRAELNIQGLGDNAIAQANSTSLPTPDFAVDTKFKTNQIQENLEAGAAVG